VLSVEWWNRKPITLKMLTIVLRFYFTHILKICNDYFDKSRLFITYCVTSTVVNVCQTT